MPKLYDVAFSHRDIAAEVHVVTEWYLTVSGGKALKSVLEVAAGPAGHALEYAKRGVKATALDLSPKMVEYAKMKARQSGVFLKIVEADMLEFALPERFDLALSMQDSASHILSIKDMVKHLQCVARHLNADGLYVMELAMPAREQRRMTSPNKWSATTDDVEVEIEWGSSNDTYDAKSGIVSTTITVNANVDGRKLKCTDTLNTKIWTQYAMERSIAASGAFRIAGKYGAFSSGCSSGDATAWRLIYVLKSAFS
jgi:SAM-dependent methyltransferase